MDRTSQKIQEEEQLLCPFGIRHVYRSKEVKRARGIDHPNFWRLSDSSVEAPTLDSNVLIDVIPTRY